ncbi:MAG TPA: GNAT family N-acetyltransferase [Longimicrobiaceae bacterium]|nr:GNAT family N-acetyltransferase [Longimicrobiaceae bacterium]
MPAQIRVLDAGDAPVYVELRLRALREHPEAFATSYEEERARSLAEAARKVAPGPEHVTLGAFDGDRLVGMATLVRPGKAKMRHRASIAAMYVAPEAQGRGLGRALLDRALAVAGEWGVSEVSLMVTVGNDAARSLYAGAGFVPYGVEPRSLCVEGRFHDVELMNLRLR